MSQKASGETGENSIAKLIGEIVGRHPSRSAVFEAAGYRLNRILVISTEYDFFILDEEGRLRNLLVQQCRREERSTVPILVHATEENALEAMKGNDFDAALFFNPPAKSDISELAKSLRSVKNIPLVLVGRNTPEVYEMMGSCKPCPVDHVFTWSGDGKVFLDIIMFLEDSVRTEGISPGPVILLADSQPQYYSKLVYEAYRVIADHMAAVVPDELPRTQKSERMQRRPRVMLAKSLGQFETLSRRLKDSVACVLLDMNLDASDSKSDAKASVSAIAKGSPELPLLLFSCTGHGKYKCLDKNSPMTLSECGRFMADAIGPTALVLRDTSGKEIARVSNIRELESSLWSLPIDCFEKHMRCGEIARWLGVLMEDALAEQMLVLSKAFSDPEELRKKAIAAISEYKKTTQRGVITTYARGEGQQTRFSRIGKGAMGGKARGLAFADKLINTYLREDAIPGLNVKIPRTIVLCSDIFDQFIEDNNIIIKDLYNFSDERIAQKFMEGDLPAPVLGDIRAFIRGTKSPIVVRSSSLLEDALHHPFAGVYASLLLPNESWETDIRFQELCASIKYVFASVFFQKARTYMASLKDIREDEKMAVVVQELVGSKHGSIFYPTISGVAKSYDYYPSGRCKATDGVVNIALGLGKEVVDGGTAYRFCPVHPKTPKHGTLENLLEHAQKDFFAVDLNSYVNIVQRNEDSTIKHFPISVAESHGSLENVASTYERGEGRLYPGTGRDGIRVLDFAPLINLETYPVAKLLHALLRVNELAVGSPVEIEFAMDIPSESNQQPDFYVLQVRSMRSTEQDFDIDLGTHAPDETFCHAMHAMGNGVISGIRDIVYVKRGNYDIADNQKIIPQIRAMNEKMLKSRTPYILVGPGRWGSTDPWLGIPVNWSDIAGARLIVETPIEERPVDPSQGSHFFHNMVAARTGYLTIIPGTESSIDWGWLEGIDSAEEKQHIRHVRLPEPVEIRINGGRGEGVILKKAKPGAE